MKFDLGSNLVAALSEKKDGDMSLDPQATDIKKVKQNRKEFLNSLGLDVSDMVFADLAHSNSVEIVSKVKRGSTISSTDGLLTRDPNLYLGFTVADCLPVFLFEPKKAIVGLVHCGWRGLSQDILCKTCGKIRRNWGKDLEKLQVFIGPGICKKHFEIEEDVAKQFNQYQQAVEKKEAGLFLDLKEVAKLQLLSEGVKEKNIQISSECTYELEDKYYSYRRNDTFFRNLAVIGRRG